MVLLLQYNIIRPYCNFYIHKRKNNLNKATEENNTSVLFIRFSGGGVTTPKHTSIFLTSKAL